MRSKLTRIAKRVMAIVLSAAMLVSLMPTSAIFAEEDDTPYVISQGRATYASTYTGYNSSDNAVDGDAGSRWESVWTNTSEWFYVDLGKKANISSIYISWEGAYAKAYNIQISDDEENWETVYENSACQGGEETINLIENARYVRINMTEKALSAYGYSFYEFQVYGTGGLTKRPENYGDNIALDKETVCSGLREEWWMFDDAGNLKEDSVASVQASNANDGDENSSFTSYQSNNQWIYVDLGQEYEIGRVIIEWTGDAGKVYDIQTSNDAENWTTVYRRLNGYADLTDNIPVYIESARYVRMYGYSRVENGSGFGIRELEVYEYDGESEKISYTISELPETIVVNRGAASYVTNDLYLENAKLPTYIDEENVDYPIASNDWWQSAIIRKFGNLMNTLPFKTGYSKKGLSVLTTTGGWLPTPGETDVNISVGTETVADLYVLPENVDTLSAYDRVHESSDYEAKLQLCDENGILMTSTHIKGSPYIYCDFGKTEAFYISVPNLTGFFDDNGNEILAAGEKITTDHIGIHVTDTDNEEKTKTSNSYYCISLPEGTVIKNNAGTLKITLPANDRYMSIGTMLEKSQLNTFYQHGYAFVTDTHVTYEYNEIMSEITSNYVVTTDLKREGFSNTTMQLMLPHQWKYAKEDEDTAVVYESIRGDMHGIWSNSFTTVDRFEGILPNFAMPANSEFDHDKVLDYLNALESGTSNVYPVADAYWEGKTIHPLAMGVLMADQLGETELRDTFLERLKKRLVDWFTYSGTDDACFFIYDEHWGTLYYKTSEFGANTGICDHHFTYGYFLFGATILAAYDKEFYNDYKDMIEILIRDYANPSEEDGEYCRFRAYDMYEGHSWAGGYADNDNGNNQESASESLFSWASMYMWGVLTENDVYRDAGVFGFTNEMEAVSQYWFDYDKTNWVEDWPYDVVAQIYGGGNFFGTFFGGYPVYCYGIQWLPISEYLTYYGINQERCAEIYAGLERDTAAARDKAYTANINNGMTEEEAQEEYNKYPTEDTGWQHITWPFLSQTDPERALEKFSNNENVIGSGDRATTYWFINSMLDVGHKTDEIIAAGEPSATVYYNEDTGVYTANVWNPCNTAKEVSFVRVADDSVLGTATVAANSLVRFEVNTDEVFEYTQADTPKFNITGMADGKVSNNISGTVECDDTQLVEITTATEGATIYYTTDGTTPSTESQVYTGAFVVSSDTIIKAIAAKENCIDSAYASLELVINGDTVNRGVNLALGKNVEASSLQSNEAGYAADNMTDGDYDSRWSSAAGNDSDYCIVDLGSVYIINTVKLFWEAAYGRVYDIQVSTDGKIWTTVSTITNGTAGQTDITFEAVDARYVKMQGVERATVYGYSLYEFEVYEALQAEAPVITPVSGSYDSEQTVTITSTVKGAEIKYTTDGSNPTEESDTYVAPFVVDKSTIVKAVTYRKGMMLSQQAVSTLVIDGTVALDSSKITVAIGDTRKLTAVANGNVTWTSRDNSIATVDENGNVSGVSRGTTTIVATAGNYKAECQVEVVEPVKLQSINLSYDEITIKAESTGKLTYTLNPENTTDDVSNIKWSSSDTSIVEVENGKITGKAEGTAVITLSCGDIKAECIVTVLPKYTMEEKVTNPEFNVLLKGSTVYQSGCYEGDKDNLIDGKGFGASIGDNWASQIVNSSSSESFLIFELSDSYTINQIEALYIHWKNNVDTLPTDGFKIMVANEDDFDITTGTSNKQNYSGSEITIVTEDRTNWTTVFDSSVNDATNAEEGYDWAVTDTGCVSILPLSDTYSEKFKYIKIAFDYEGASKPWGIQAYEVALVVNEQEPDLDDGGENETKTSVTLDGFQISTTLGGSRTVYTVENESDNVVERGLIYGLANYATTSDMYVGADSTYVKSFASTQAGVFTSNETSTTYVMTMTMGIGSISAEGLSAEYMVRAYAKLSDGTYIYSEVGSYSLYGVADYLYSEQKMTSQEAHDYLYNNILHIVNDKYELVEFKASNSVVTP